MFDKLCAECPNDSHYLWWIYTLVYTNLEVQKKDTVSSDKLMGARLVSRGDEL